MDADAPYDEKWTPIGEARPMARPDNLTNMVKCPVKSPMPNKWVKKGHEGVLCYNDPQDPPETPERPPEPPQCTYYYDPSQGVVQVALSYVKQCA